MRRTGLVAALATLSLVMGPALAGTTGWQLKINGMVCSFCARGIQTKLEAIPGVSGIRIDMKTRTIRMVTGGAFGGTAETLSKAVREAGYVVQSIEQVSPTGVH